MMNYSATTGRARGPRPGRPDTRREILLAARDLFLADGYRGVTLRAVAGAASVDVALVSYYFGSKRGLFAACLDLPENPPDLLRAALPGDRATLPERILRILITTWDDPERGAALRAMLLTAAQEPSVGRLLREVFAHEIVDVLVAHIGGPGATRKAAAVTTQVIGLLFGRYVLALEPVASMNLDDVVRTYAPGLRAVLSGQAHSIRSPRRRSEP